MLFLLFFFKLSIHFTENKLQKICTISFYIFQIFYCHISNVVNKNIFVLFCSFSLTVTLIRTKFFKLIKSLRKYYVQFFYVYIFDFITIFYNQFVNIKLLLVHYLRSEMVITFFPSILSNNSKY